MTTITLDEWQAEMERLEAQAQDIEAFTVRDIREMDSPFWGTSPKAIREKIRVAMEHGMAVRVWVKRKSISGMTSVPAYQFKRPKEE
jgi:hypothetical protein